MARKKTDTAESLDGSMDGAPHVLKTTPAAMAPYVPAGENPRDITVQSALLRIARAEYHRLTGQGHQSWRVGYPFPVSAAIRQAGIALARELAG